MASQGTEQDRTVSQSAGIRYREAAFSSAGKACLETYRLVAASTVVLVVTFKVDALAVAQCVTGDAIGRALPGDTHWSARLHRTTLQIERSGQRTL